MTNGEARIAGIPTPTNPPTSHQPPIGRVLGTEDSTPLSWHVALNEDAYLQLDDVVITSRDVPGFGTGHDRRRGHRGHRQARGRQLRLGRLPDQRRRPARPGPGDRGDHHHQGRAGVLRPAPPRRAGPAARPARTASTRCTSTRWTASCPSAPAATAPRSTSTSTSSTAPAARTSRSAASPASPPRPATRCSCCTPSFAPACSAAEPSTPRRWCSRSRARTCCSSTTPTSGSNDELRQKYADLGLPAEPFDSVGFYSPPTPDDLTGKPHVAGRTSGVEPFWWTLAEFCTGELLPYVFTDAEDERNQYTMVVSQVAARLRLDAEPAGKDGAVSIDGDTCRTYDELVDVIVARLTDDATRPQWAGPVTGVGTINAFIRRLRSSLQPLRALIRADLPDTGTRQISTGNQQVTVVDLHNLRERAQRFVVGVVLAAETARKEAAGPGSLLFTMIDELNKYAPREGNSPIKDVLLDIAERGRSLGIILIGAQQTASEVERRIVSNSSIKVVGRLDAAEAGRPEYGFLPPSQRTRATLAKPGTMFVSQPEIPVPLSIEFPFPAWATRQAECGTAPPRRRTGRPPPRSSGCRCPPTTPRRSDETRNKGGET